jgi:hypothetical protein
LIFRDLTKDDPPDYGEVVDLKIELTQVPSEEMDQ